MKSKFIPPLKKAVLPEDINSEVENIAANEIIEHGLGNNSKYYILIRIETNKEGTDLEILEYDVKDVPEGAVEEFSKKLDDLKISR